MVAQTQMFPKREAVQQLKDRLQTWVKEENRRELEGVTLPGGASPGTAGRLDGIALSYDDRAPSPRTHKRVKSPSEVVYWIVSLPL